MIYLDHAATTPVDPQVLAAMQPYFSELYGNALSVHRYGQKADYAVEQARQTLAGLLNCKPSEIIFTSGGTESDNLALRGAAWAARQQGRGHHLITSPVEHSAVGRTVAQLVESMGFTATCLPVDAAGRVNPADFDRACVPGTTVASVMLASNEIGTLQPVAELAAIARQRGVLLHTDAVQAPGQLDLDVQRLGVDLLSLSAHKFYGPKGIGLLYVREGTPLLPAQTGGSHEAGRRAGTHSTPLIVGMARALALATAAQAQRISHYTARRDQLIAGLLARVPGLQLTGHPVDRLPGHASFTLPDVEANQLLMHLDLRGLAASSASACKTGSPEPSEVLLALGYAVAAARGGLRLTVGKDTTAADIDRAIDIVAEAVAALRRLGARSRLPV
jgi:cysteine desulfurase